MKKAPNNSKKKKQKKSQSPQSNSIIAILCLLLIITLATIYFSQDDSTPSQSGKTATSIQAPQKINTAVTTPRLRNPETQQEKRYDDIINHVNVTYPSDWTVTNGHYYAPGDEKSDISIQVNKKATKESLPLAEYVEKYAGWETGPSRTPVNITKIQTQSGLTGYRVEWSPNQWTAGRKSYTTFFEIPGDTASTIQVIYTGDEYVSIYDSMISSLSF